MRNNVTKRVVFERYLTDSEVAQLLKYIGKVADDLAERDHAWIRLALATGVRVGTLAGLTVGDATDARESKRLIVRDEIAKGQHGYEVFVNKQGRSALMDLLMLRRRLGAESNARAGALILSRRGQPISVRSLQHRLRYWCRLAQLPVLASPHWLRHTLAKRLMRDSEAADPQGIAQLALGHSHRRTTEIYTLPDREEVAAAMERAR